MCRATALLQITGEMPVNKDVLMSFPKMRILDMSCETLKRPADCMVTPAYCWHPRLLGSLHAGRAVATLTTMLPRPVPFPAVNKFTGGLPPGWGMKQTIPNMELM